METKIYIPDEIGGKWKKLAMERFGYGRGSISKAAEEALVFWTNNAQRIKNTFSRFVEIARGNANIIAILVFGSYARKEIYRDVDVAVIVNERFPITGYLNTISDFERVIPEGLSIDVNLFNNLDLGMRSRILSEGVILFERDRKELFELTSKIIWEYSDFRPLLESVIGE